MFFYDVICFCCLKEFRLYEGSKEYKLYKVNRKLLYCCVQCHGNIRLEAIKHFFR
ncbi:DUF2197 domain-containing protein [Bacillus sp. JJ664]